MAFSDSFSDTIDGLPSGWRFADVEFSVRDAQRHEAVPVLQRLGVALDGQGRGRVRVAHRAGEGHNPSIVRSAFSQLDAWGVGGSAVTLVGLEEEVQVGEVIEPRTETRRRTVRDGDYSRR
jgi:hypothetical protein